MRDPYPIHGKRRPWYAPWRVICRCGLGAYPCPAKRMLDRAATAELGDPRLYADGLAYAKEWQAAERKRWRGAR